MLSLVAVVVLPGKAQQATTALTLAQAMELAVRNNPGVVIADSDVAEAVGTRARGLAALLPRATGSSFVNRENRNLAVAGLSIPNVPNVVPPYTFMDFRVSAVQPIVDRPAYHGWKSSALAADSASHTAQDVRDLVAREAAGRYLTAQAASAAVDAANATVETSVALEQLARDQQDQGLATGLDVVRAQVQLARDRQSALVADNAFESSVLALTRYIGLDLGTSIELSEPLAYRAVALPDIDHAVAEALAERADYQALVAEERAVVEQQSEVAARRLPKIAVSGDYGALGRGLDSLPGIGEVQATLTVNLFDRDRAGEAQQVAARRQHLDAQLEDLRRGIEQELRQAVLDVQSAAEQVSVAEAAVNLAARELDLAEDRFRNGVSDNVEVVAAQDSLARARDDRIAALARHAAARLALARALGSTGRFFNDNGRQP